MVEAIHINGKLFNKENLYELQTMPESKELWFLSVCDFLSHWFDDTDRIVSVTSGSTGQPKEIKLSKELMRNSARMTNAFFQLDGTKTALLCLPASYIAGKMMIVRAIVGNFQLVAVEPKSNPFESITTAIDFTAVTPFQLFHSIESLKKGLIYKVIVGGSMVTKKLEELVENLPTEIYETYGMTETASHIALRRINGTEKSEFFKVLEGVNVQLDNRGCLVINATHLVENEIITNDRVELKDHHSFRWLGRVDTVINSGGIKIFPEQVERKLNDLIDCQFFISSIPDKLLGNKVVLIIESSPFDVEKETNLKTQMKNRLAKYEIPKLFFYLPAFVFSVSKKILRTETLKNIDFSA